MLTENRTKIIRVKDKKEFIKAFNEAKPSKEFFESCRKAGELFMQGEGCGYCNQKPKFDSDGYYEKYWNEVEIADGAWTSLKIGVDEEGRICMRALGDGYTENYYPKYCPNCGRKLQGE